MVVGDTQPLRCSITDLCGAGVPSPMARQMRLREQMHRWATDEVDFVQLREKPLEGYELLSLALAAMEELETLASRSGRARKTRLVINGRVDIAAAAGADGVHLTARVGELSPAQVRQVFRSAALRECLVSVSCHALDEVIRARDAGADLLLFGPVFEKRAASRLVMEGVGLERLREACGAAGPVPVLALGGITAENAALALGAGAAGIAGIRLFR